MPSLRCRRKRGRKPEEEGEGTRCSSFPVPSLSIRALPPLPCFTPATQAIHARTTYLHGPYIARVKVEPGINFL